MVDYLESLERLVMPDDLHANECKKLGIGLTEDFDIVQQALLELNSIKEANPSEALKCLEEIRERFSDDSKGNNSWGFKISQELNTIKQYILKTQEPKCYLRWEDLEFTDEPKEMIVRMGDNVYKMTYRNRDGGWITLEDCQRIYLDLLENEKKFFNDLHLEVVK